MDKVIAAGNILMCDDGIAVKAIRNLSRKLASDGFEIVIAETDTDYFMDMISSDDFLYVVDCTNFGIEPGSLSVIPLSCMENHTAASIHSFNYLSAINYYNVKVKGCLIGIEISKIEFNCDLSAFMSNKFSFICDELYKKILSLRRQKEAVQI